MLVSQYLSGRSSGCAYRDEEATDDLQKVDRTDVHQSLSGKKNVQRAPLCAVTKSPTKNRQAQRERKKRHFNIICMHQRQDPKEDQTPELPMVEPPASCCPFLICPAGLPARFETESSIPSDTLQNLLDPPSGGRSCSRQTERQRQYRVRSVRWSQIGTVRRAEVVANAKTLGDVTEREK